MGEKSVNVAAPTAPQTVAQSTADWVANAPAVFAEQQRQAPLQVQQTLDLINQYGLPLSQAVQNIDQSLYPQTAALQENIAGQATQGMNATQMPDWMRSQYLSDYNANLGTNAGSPIGAEYVSRGMQNQLFQQQNYYRDLGLTAAGRQPLSTAQSPQYNNYTAGFTPNAVNSYNMQAYNAFSPLQQSYNNQMGMLSMMPSQGERAGQAWGQYLMSR